MQLLVRYETAGFDAWKAAFDGDAEDRMNAGLTLLQMWREADAPNTAICLFEANQREKADAWLSRETALGAPASATFLRTA